MNFIHWAIFFFILIFLIYFSKKKFSPETFYQYNDAQALSNYPVIISFTDNYNDYRSKSWRNKALGIKKQSYTSFKKNSFYKDYLVYTGKINLFLKGTVSDNNLTSGWLIISLDGFTLKKTKIWNYIFKVYLGSDENRQIYVTSKYTKDCIWSLVSTGNNAYNIIHTSTGLYLNSSEPNDAKSFLRQKTASLKYDYGIVVLKPKPFNWLVVPHPPLWAGSFGNYRQAKNICASRGMGICTLNQIQKAANLKRSICASSWINQYNENTNTLTTGWPMGYTPSSGGCGREGVNRNPNIPLTRNRQTIHWVSNCWQCGKRWCYGGGIRPWNRPNIEASFNVGKPLSQWGCSNMWKQNGGRGSGWVRNSVSGAIYAVENNPIPISGVTCCPKYTMTSNKNLFSINFQGESWSMDSQWYNVFWRGSVGHRRIWPAFRNKFRGKPYGYKAIGTIVNNRNNQVSTGNGMVLMGINTSEWYMTLRVLQSNNGKYVSMVKKIYYNYGNINFGGISWAIDEQWFSNSNGVGRKIIWPWFISRLDSNNKVGMEILGRIINNSNRSSNSGNGMQIVATYYNCVGPIFNFYVLEGKRYKYSNKVVNLSQFGLFNKWLTVPGNGYCRTNYGNSGKNHGPWGWHSGNCFNTIRKCKQRCDSDGNCVAFTWNPKAKGCEFMCNQRSGLCPRNGNAINSIPCYNTTDKRDNYSKCFTKSCNTWIGSSGFGCGNKPVYINYYGTSGNNKGKKSLIECKDLCTLNKNCSGYLFSNTGTCYHYMFKPRQQIYYQCGKPSSSSKYAGDIKNGIPIGCYRDCRNGRDLPVYTVSRGVSESVCANQARSRSKQYYGHQWWGQCWAGNRYGTQGSIQSCTPKRLDNWRGGCRNMVYKNPAIGYIKNWDKVPGLSGFTYIDPDTRGGPWALIGYGAGGNLGSLLNRNWGNFSPWRQNSAVLDGRQLLRKNGRMVIAWSRSGKPRSNIVDYQYAVEFKFQNPSAISMSGALSPPIGTGRGNFSKNNPSHAITVTSIKGNPQLPRRMFVRNTFAVMYGSAMGIVMSSGGNPQLDWNPDGQPFQGIYIGYRGNALIIFGPGSNRHMYVPSTLSVWAKI